MGKINFDRLSNHNILVRTIHSAVKGRARYKVHGLYGSEALKRYLGYKLSKEEGIVQVSANIYTGNVLVMFRPDFSPQAIALVIKRIVLDFQSKNKESLAKVPAKKVNVNHGREQGQLRIQPTFSRKMTKLATSSLEQQILPWHILQADTAIAKLTEGIADLHTSTTSGLSHITAQAQLQKYGANVLPESQTRSKLSIFVEQFKSLPVALLTVAAGLSITTGLHKGDRTPRAIPTICIHRLVQVLYVLVAFLASCLCMTCLLYK
jgi:P-type Ca2+ transporter type 2C